MASYVQEVQSEASLVHYWQHQETSGTNAADSKGSLNGTIGGAPAFGSDCPVTVAPNCLILDGVDDQVDIAHNADMVNAQFSVEFWWKQAATGVDFRVIFQKASTTNWTGGPTFYCVTGSNAIQFATAIYSTSITTANLTVDTWYHIVGTRDATSTRLYVNGALVAGPTADAAPTSTNAAGVGYPPPGGGAHQTGSFAHLAYYNAELNATRVQAHYDARANAASAGATGVFIPRRMPLGV